MEDLHSLFEKESFDKFTDGIVQQFMKEEELRAHHQVSFYDDFFFFLHFIQESLFSKDQ